MWVCPKCKTGNNDSFRMCWWCHTEPDGTEHPRLITKLAKRMPNQVGVPRRFSVGTLLILIALFAVLFSFLKVYNFPPYAFALIGVFFVVIGAAQALLFKGKKPREASIIAGGVFALTINIVLGLLSGGSILEILLPSIVCSVTSGCIFGYAAGCLIAGIFLVRERRSDEETVAHCTFDDEEDGEKVEKEEND